MCQPKVTYGSSLSLLAGLLLLSCHWDVIQACVKINECVYLFDTRNKKGTRAYSMKEGVLYNVDIIFIIHRFMISTRALTSLTNKPINNLSKEPIIRKYLSLCILVHVQRKNSTFHIVTYLILAPGTTHSLPPTLFLHVKIVCVIGRIL